MIEAVVSSLIETFEIFEIVGVSLTALTVSVNDSLSETLPSVAAIETFALPDAFALGVRTTEQVTVPFAELT